ncbi:copper chaperone PCu(A)C [Deinococcus sp.]|uniref:copper chaperone PCu(A)C n=1 Tax=Deinococcus sp. TaxID=47478 RepID=UPI0025C37F25|nr:copper chaperone PCu(A)C [Deinococcus sp.]
MLKNLSPTVFALALSGLPTLVAWPAMAQNHNMGSHTMNHAMPMPAQTAKPVAQPGVKAVLPLSVQNAVIVAVPPSIKETSAFMTLKNTSGQAVMLSGATATFAGHSMLMHTLKAQNMSGMVAAPVLVVPAHGTLSLKSDGDHVMLSALKRPLKVGEVLPIVLQASDGRTLSVKAAVKKP